MAGSEMLVGKSSLIIGDDAAFYASGGRSLAYSQCDCSAASE